MSGSVNAHTHLYSGLVPLGLPPLDPPPDSFSEILERLWWQLDRALDHDILRAAARHYVGEALLQGTTTIIDHHESPAAIDGSLDILADACEELGVRAVLCYGATERNGGEAEAQQGLAECKRFAKENDRPLIRAMVGLHASFTVSDETVRRAGALCRELDLPLHIHLAEAEIDRADSIERGYAGPLERLIALDALPEGSILAHGIHLDEDQVRLAAERGCWFVQNPRSNHGNGVGYPSALAVSDRVALGTDGYPSVLDEELQAVHEGVETGHARLACGQRIIEGLFGELEDDLVYSDSQLLHSVVAGRTVVRDGMLVTADRQKLLDEARHQAVRLLERMKAL